MARHGSEGKTRAAEPEAEPKTTQSQGERKRKRERNFKRWQQQQRPQGVAKATGESSGVGFKEKYHSRYKKQLLNTTEPSGRPGSGDFRQWNPPCFRTKIAYLVHYYNDRPKVEWLSWDFIKKCFHPLQRCRLWRRFESERKCASNEVQVRYDRLYNKRPRPDICKQLMVLALFGHPGTGWQR